MSEDIANDVREFGYSLLSISDGEPPFVYTVGLMQSCNHPELIAFGLEPGSAGGLVRGLIKLIREGQSFREPGVHTLTNENGQYRVGFRVVHPTQHPLYLGYAMGFCREIGRWGELEAVQVFWPDKKGKFPFDAGCDEAAYRLQPRLDVGLTPREVREFERQWG
jgi:hypothetical protein